MSNAPTTHNSSAGLTAPTGPAQSTRAFFDDNWNFTIHYPSDWDIIYENEPIGAWIMPIAIAGPGTKEERPAFMISVRYNATWHGAGSPGIDSAAPAAATPDTTKASGIGAKLPRVIQDYIASSDAELGQNLAGYKLISVTMIYLAHRPTVWFAYSYNGRHRRICEESFTVFDARVTFWLVCRAPLAHYAQMRPCFQNILTSFSIGHETAESR